MLLRKKFYGFSSWKYPTTDGARSIFAGNSNGSTNASSYYYSSDTTAGTTTLYSDVAGAFSNAMLGVFTSVSSGIQKYSFSSSVVTAEGKYFTVNVGLNNATNIAARGLFGLDSAGAGSMRSYWFQTSTLATSTSLPNRTQGGFGVGNDTVAIFGRGFGATSNVTSDSAQTNKYTYSGDTTATATDLTYTCSYSGAAGNAAFGIIQIGLYSNGTTNTNKYTYSGDTTAAGLTLRSNTRNTQATGPSSFGLFPLISLLNQVDKYNYSPDSVVSATALVINNPVAAAADGTLGVNV